MFHIFYDELNEAPGWPLDNSENETSVSGSTCFGCETKTGVRILVFFKIDLCSAVSFKRLRRELSIDVAEHRSILKNEGEMRILVIF